MIAFPGEVDTAFKAAQKLMKFNHIRVLFDLL